MAHGVLRQGITDINTSSKADLKMVGEQLERDGEGHFAGRSPSTPQRPSRRADMALCTVVGFNAQNYLPRAPAPRSFGTGSFGLRAWSTTTCSLRSKAGRTRCWRTCSSNHILDLMWRCRTSPQSATSRRSNSFSLICESAIHPPKTCGLAIVKPEYFDTATGCLTLTRPTTPHGTTCADSFQGRVETPRRSR